MKMFTYMKFIDSKFRNESGIEPVNLLELKSLKEKDGDHYDEVMAHGHNQILTIEYNERYFKFPIILYFLSFCCLF